MSRFILRTISILVITGLAGLGGVTCEGVERIAFATSVTGNGNLGTWPDAGGNNGLQAADAICQARATAAGLANPGDFVAWLSDSSDDAYCRIHGLSGTKAGNCGQAALPTSAGPWVRMDGYAFAPAIGEALGNNGVIYGPVTFDEFGAIPAQSLIFTETTMAGTYAAQTSAACGDWTSTTDNVEYGDLTSGTVAWTAGGTTACFSNIRLLCMQTGSGDPLPPYWRQGAKVFVTTATGAGNLGTWPEAGGAVGIAAGNTICQARATATGLADPLSYRAWLSGSTNNAISQLALDGPWSRLDGVLIAMSKADLTDGQLLAPPNIDDSGTYLGNIGVWTGTTSTGMASPNTCSDWSDGTSSTGVSGSTYRSNSWWTEFGGGSGCTAPFHLYCFSNSITDLFFNDFESANTAAWSATKP